MTFFARVGSTRRCRLGHGARLLRAGGLEESAEVLDGLSQAVHYPGRSRAGDRAQGAGVRRLPAARRCGVEAAELARWLAFLHGAVHGNPAAANGWMARAESLLEGVEECAAHGWLTLDRAPFTDDAVRARAPGHWRRSRSPGGSGTATSSSARWRCWARRTWPAGRVAEGMRLLDEAMAAVSGGEVRGIAHHRRDLLPAAQRLRARGRRPARGAVARRGRPLRRLDRLRRRRPAGPTTGGS